MSAHLTMHTSKFAGTKLAPRRPQCAVLSRRGVWSSPRADSVLIINTKGGGHAFLGLYLAKELLAAGHKVSILNDGDKVALPHLPPCQPRPTSFPCWPSSPSNSAPGNRQQAHRAFINRRRRRRRGHTLSTALSRAKASASHGATLRTRPPCRTGPSTWCTITTGRHWKSASPPSTRTRRASPPAAP